MSRFVYYNNNPYGRREEDCVTRAITLASGLDYKEVQEKLYYTAKLLNCDKLCICCYRHLIDDVLKYRRVDAEGYLVGEFADLHPHGIYLVRMNGHITVIINSAIYDIWDCRNQVITDCWKVE